MKTKLPLEIKTVEEAKAFLTELHANGEYFHPEDDAFTIEWQTCTPASGEECNQLNNLMYDIYNLPGNDGRHSAPMVFDPCAFLNGLDGINAPNDSNEIEPNEGLKAMIDPNNLNIYTGITVEPWDEIEIFGCKGDSEMCDDNEEPEFYKIITNHPNGPMLWLAETRSYKTAIAFQKLLNDLIINYEPFRG